MIARTVEPAAYLWQPAVPIGSKEALQLAVVRLRECAAKCPACGGLGETRTPYLVYLLTDDPRSLERAHATRWTRRNTSRVERLWRSAANLKTPCAECAPIRATIKTCEVAAL